MCTSHTPAFSSGSCSACGAQACFSACPQPTNVTSSCYLACYTTATQRMSGEKLAAPWGLAFASEDKSAGGCPTVVVPS